MNIACALLPGAEIKIRQKKSDLLAEISNSLIGLDVCIMVDTVSYCYNTWHYSLNMEALYAHLRNMKFLHMVQYIFIISYNMHVQWNTHFNTNTDIPLHMWLALTPNNEGYGTYLMFFEYCNKLILRKVSI